MIKLLSFKTRRPDLDSDAFRSYYEGQHVPLGLSYIEHFRWRKYCRNYVSCPVIGNVNFDCLTEFWISDRRDQQRGSRFVQSPEFSVLEQDDHQFLDISKRLSFAVDEHVLVASPDGNAGAHRLAMFISKPAEVTKAGFEAGILQASRSFTDAHAKDCSTVLLDLRCDESDDSTIHAVLSVWSSSPDMAMLNWPGIEYPAAVVQLESVETAQQQLFNG